MSHLHERIKKQLKRQYEIGQEDPRPWNENAQDVKEAIEELKSDGYHTFAELYRHRYVLFIALMRAEYEHLMWSPTAKQRIEDCLFIAPKHADGTMFDDSFIVGMLLPTGQVTYHLPMREWDRVAQLMPLAVVERAPEWDGHTPTEALSRLERWVYGH